MLLDGRELAKLRGEREEGREGEDERELCLEDLERGDLAGNNFAEDAGHSDGVLAREGDPGDGRWPGEGTSGNAGRAA
jgi:hypothetical protein